MSLNIFKDIKTKPAHNNVPELWRDRAKTWANKTYLHFQEQSWTYGEFNRLIHKTASGLAKLGLTKGEHAAILFPNSANFLFAWFGAMTGGFVGVTLNTLLKSAELDFIIQDSDATVLMTTPQLRRALDRVWSNFHKIKTVILSEKDDAYPDALLLSDVIASGDENFHVELAAADHATMIYTSGTTGHPKGVILTHANILYNSFVAQQLIDLQSADTALCILPLFHVNAQIASMLSTLQAGASVVLEETFKPRSFLATLKKYRCTTFSGVPTVYNYLNGMQEADGENLSFLKACVCGAAPMPVEVFNKFEEKFKTKIVEGYGLSEGTCVSSLNPLHGKRKIGSIGLAIPGQDMGIVDAQNNFLADGEIGEIVIRGPNMMVGYYKNDAANAATIVDGWLHTGDLGYCDDEGYYFISGRKKEMIIQGGENIYPKEIEEVLYKHDAIAECAIVGIPDQTYGEVVAAFIVPKEGASISDKEIKTYLRGKIANFKLPKVVEVVTALPKTATGKIQKNKIVEAYVASSKAD